MRKASDRKFDWLPALAIVAGVAVILPSLAAAAVSITAALRGLFG